MRRSFIVVLILLSSKAIGSHIVGGEFELLHINEYQYKLNLIIYFDLNFGNPGARDDFANVRIFRKSDNVPIRDVYIPFRSGSQVSYFQPECSEGEIRTEKLLYTTNIELSPEVYNDPEGYYIAWERCCRNYDITNIYSDPPGNGISAGQTFYLEFPPVVINDEQFINSSPQLFPPLNDYACPNRPYWVDFAGTDIDGDSLVYTLVTPRNTWEIAAIPEGGPQPGPYPLVRYRPGFSATNIMAGAPDLQISNNGFLTVTPTLSGLFVFAVKCEEYRDGVKIGELIRDFQMLVLGNCPVADQPLIEGKQLGDADFSYVDNMSVSFPNTVTDDQRCIEIQVSDPDALKVEDSYIEKIWLHVVPIGFDPQGQDVTGILPEVNSVVLTQGSVETFDICFPECPLVDGPYTLGIIAFDDACALPLSDTLRVTVDIEPPPNTQAYFVTSDAAETLTEGDVFELPILGKDDDGDELIVDILTNGFELADVGMSFNEPENANGEFTTVFKWETGCDIYDFTERTEFQVAILLDDADFCDLEEPDTLVLDLKVILPPNTDPVISTDLPQTSFIHPLNEPVQFKVFGLDTDGDEVELRAVGDGFELSDYEITFPYTKDVSQVEAEFSWTPNCLNAPLDGEDTNKELRFWFILNDLDKCKFPNFDSLEVNMTLIKPTNTPPVISFRNRNEQVQVLGNSADVIVGDVIDLEVLATDLEVNTISLILADSSDIPNGLAFTPTSGIGNTESVIEWEVTCDNLNEDLSPRQYTLWLASADDACFNEMESAREFTITVSDIDSDDKDFEPYNVFTPNDDGVNDTYSLENLPADNCAGEFRSFRVHNRWGTEVFVSIERDFTWTGDGLLPGVYFYVVEFTNKEYSGTVSLLR